MAGRFVRSFNKSLILGAVGVGMILPSAGAHETDQFSVPTGRQLADLRFWLSEYMYDRVAGAVDKTNAKIERSLRNGEPTARTKKYQSHLYLGKVVEDEFPNFWVHVEVMERELRSAEMSARYPGLITAYRPHRWIYHHPALVIDLTKWPRLLRCSMVMADGVYFGIDKILHFSHVGYLYFEAYEKALRKGASEEEAVAKAIEMGAGPHPFAETKALGRIATSVISNGDLVADITGFKFYRNLLEPVTVKGNIHLPPMVERDGEFFRVSPNLKRDSDFFKVFISDHFNETLNPSGFSRGGRFVRVEVKKRCADILDWYRDEQGRSFSKQEFERISQNLSTYYGEQYGHYGDLAEMVTVANVCFDGAESVAGANWVRAGDIRLASHFGANAPGREVDAFGRTALFRAARAGRIDEVSASLSAETLNVPDIDQETPLHAAVRGGHAEVVEILLREGADADAKNVHGFTPLHLAAQNAEEKIASLLLQHGANVSARDSFGCTPLHDAALRDQDGVTTMLVDAGADVNQGDRFGTTPLHRAARAGKAETILVLLSRGANPSLANASGKTALDEARASNVSNVAELLRNAPSTQTQYMLISHKP